MTEIETLIEDFLDAEEVGASERIESFLSTVLLWVLIEAEVMPTSTQAVMTRVLDEAWSLNDGVDTISLYDLQLHDRPTEPGTLATIRDEDDLEYEFGSLVEFGFDVLHFSAWVRYGREAVSVAGEVPGSAAGLLAVTLVEQGLITKETLISFLDQADWQGPNRTSLEATWRAVAGG